MTWTWPRVAAFALMLIAIVALGYRGETLAAVMVLVQALAPSVLPRGGSDGSRS